jgi:Na+/proline symporter
MPLSTLDAVLLAIQAAFLLAIGARLRRRLHAGEDFILGRRRLNMPLSVAVLSMNSVPIWWLLMLVGAAYAMGLAASWLALALFGGVAIGGWYLAPRLRALTNLQQRSTFSELLVGDAGEKMRAILFRSTLLIIVLTLVFSSTVQLQLAARFLNDVFGFPPAGVIGVIGLVLGLSVLLAGFWTTAIADTWQMVVWVVACIVVLVALSIAIWQSTDATLIVFRGDWFAQQRGLLTISFTLGMGFVASDVVGQAPLLTRYMACSTDTELERARAFSLLWAAVVLPLALLIGWCIRALSGGAPDMDAYVAVLSRALTPQLTAIILLLVLGAGTVAIGSGLQTAAAHLANDLRRGGVPASLTHCRVALFLVVLLAVATAIYLPLAGMQKNFDRLMFCWHALGATFGPLLIVRLSGKRVRAGSTLGSIWSGFLLTVVFYLMPDTPGELLERGLPFTAALGIALSGGERRRNPDRADRGERTVHDRLPI